MFTVCAPFALMIRAARAHQRYNNVCVLYCTAYTWFCVRAERLPTLDGDDQRLQRVNVPRCAEDVRVNSTRKPKQNIHSVSMLRLRTTQVQRLNRVSSLQWTRLRSPPGARAVQSKSATHACYHQHARHNGGMAKTQNCHAELIGGDIVRPIRVCLPGHLKL